MEKILRILFSDVANLCWQDWFICRHFEQYLFHLAHVMSHMCFPFVQRKHFAQSFYFQNVVRWAGGSHLRDSDCLCGTKDVKGYCRP